MTFFWRLAKRLVSGALFGVALTLMVSMIVRSHAPGIAGLSFALGLAVGFLFYKTAAVFSASLVTIYVIRGLFTPWLPCEVVLLSSLVFAAVLYEVSKTRDFVPYTLSGASALLWSVSEVLGLPPAAVLSSLTGVFAYLLQDANLRARRKYERLLALRPGLKPKPVERGLLRRRLRERQELRAF